MKLYVCWLSEINKQFFRIQNKKRLNLYPIVKITFVENKSGDGVRGKKKKEKVTHLA